MKKFHSSILVDLFMRIIIGMYPRINRLRWNVYLFYQIYLFFFHYRYIISKKITSRELSSLAEFMSLTRYKKLFTVIHF